MQMQLRRYLPPMHCKLRRQLALGRLGEAGHLDSGETPPSAAPPAHEADNLNNNNK